MGAKILSKDKQKSPPENSIWSDLEKICFSIDYLFFIDVNAENFKI